jgi:hypothetical protein
MNINQDDQAWNGSKLWLCPVLLKGRHDLSANGQSYSLTPSDALVSQSVIPSRKKFGRAAPYATISGLCIWNAVTQGGPLGIGQPWAE